MRARARRRGPRTAGPSLSGLVAGLSVVVLTIVLLALQATVFEVVRFVLFTVVAVALPGFALWRLIGGYGRNLVEDLSAGFAVGTAGQVLVYLASASIGLQAWSWVWAPVVLVITFVEVTPAPGSGGGSSDPCARCRPGCSRRRPRSCC